MRGWLTVTMVCLALGCGDDADSDGRGGTGLGSNQGGSSGAAGNAGRGGSGGFHNPNPDAAFMLPDIDASLPTVCADLETTPERLPPTITFLIDGSTSMTCRYPEDLGCDCESQVLGSCAAAGSGERWSALGTALFDSAASGGQDGPVAALAPLIRFGMAIYNNGPDPDNSACPNLPVTIAAALDNHAALAGAFPAEPPGANTPTGPALAELVASLPDAATRRAQGLGPDSIVLATDGQPFTCLDQVTLDRELDYASVVSAAEAAAAKGIAVYVVSLAPASGGFATHLEDVAQAGGTGQAYLPTDQVALTTRLRGIATDQIPCELRLDGEVTPGKECDGKVLLDDELLDCNGANGWKLVDAHHIELTGSACTRYKEDPNAKLAASFPCGIFVPG
jgi:hypothetical protein